MNLKPIYFMLFLLLMVSCQDDSEQRILEQKKEAKKREDIFNKINNAWGFKIATMEPGAQAVSNSWQEWRTFVNEANLKPKSTIGAFQKKASMLSKRAMELNNNIPMQYNLPQIKSRVAVLVSNMRSLDMYVHLNDIPEEKVIAYLQSSNVEIISLQKQMEEIIRKSYIPIEEYESDVFRMKDTSRAIPNTVPEDLKE